jgi:hypothetical protein
MKNWILVCLIFIIASKLFCIDNSGVKEPLAAYQLENKWHFIGYDGKELFPAMDLSDVFGYSEGLFCVSKKVGNQEKWGYLNTEGKFVIEPQYDKAELFSEGYAVVFNLRDDDNYPVFYYFINTKGEYLIKDTLIDALGFSEGLAFFMDKNLKAGYIDKTGKKVINFSQMNGNKFSEGLASVSNQDYRMGFIDKTGKQIIDFHYTNVGNFSHRLASVYIDDKFGYINAKDSLIIDEKFDNANEFKEGRAFVSKSDLINMTNTWALIDTNGFMVTDFIYDHVYNFNEGLAAVSMNTEWGYIDNFGRFYIKPQYSFCANFVNGIAWVSDKKIKEAGFINKKAEFVIKINNYKTMVDLRLNQIVY